MIIVTVNSPDTVACAKKIGLVLQDNKKIPIFCLQRGVRNSYLLKAELESYTVIEGAIGFAVVPDGLNGLVPTTMSPSILFERLSDESYKIAEGPINLIESTKLMLYFRRNITRE